MRAFGVWKEKTEIGKILTEELGLPVLLQNNVDAFAQAELLYGVGRTKSNLLIIKWGPGVGGTVVINDQIYEGRRGRSAEIGHYIVDPHGERCGCGRRECLETVVSYKALQKILPFPAGGFGEAYEEAPEIKRELSKKHMLYACVFQTRIYVWFLLLGLSGMLITISPFSNAGFRYRFRKLSFDLRFIFFMS